MAKLCYIHKGLLCNNDSELTTTTCNNMDDSINVKQKKTDSKEYTLYDSIYKTSKTDKTN